MGASMASTASGKDRTVNDPASMEDTVPNLSLEDTSTQIRRGLAPARSSGAAGFNPYDTFPHVGPANGQDRNAELRRLSAWIREKRAAEQLKAGMKPGKDAKK